MNCSKCGKYLGYVAAVAKGKDICKKCRTKFEVQAVVEFGLRIVWIKKPLGIIVPKGLEIVEAA